MAAKPTPAEVLQKYRELIPPDVRQDILDRMLKARLRSFEDFIDVTTFIMAHTLAGNIPHETADTLKGYFELLFTAVSAQSLTGKSATGGIDADTIKKARAASARRLESRVILDETAEGLKVRVGVGRPEDQE